MFPLREAIMTAETQPAISDLEQKASENFQSYQDQMCSQVDRMMAYLLTAEWVGAILVAIFFSPKTWDGLESRVHPHIWAVLSLGPLVVGGPLALAFLYPARAFTRHFIAVAQILISA